MAVYKVTRDDQVESSLEPSTVKNLRKFGVVPRSQQTVVISHVSHAVGGEETF